LTYPDPSLAAHLYHQILTGERNVVVWGGNASSTMYEWQRQVQPLFLVDTIWVWWRTETFHGLPVNAPIEIEKLDPDKTVVINNFYTSPLISQKMSLFLKTIGGYTLLPPTSLYKMANLSAGLINPQRPTRDAEPDLLARVDGTLADILTQPEQLHARRTLPAVAELESFFRSYSAQAYIELASMRLREESRSSYKPRHGRICLLIGTIDYGGAERQICNLAVALKREGWDPVVYYYYETHGGATYRSFLAENGVALEHIDQGEIQSPGQFVTDFEGLSQQARLLLWHREEPAFHLIMSIYRKLQKFRPEVVISYLDQVNVSTAQVAVMLGVPHIMMSGRSVAPNHLTYMLDPAQTACLSGLYRELVNLSNVTLSNNSSAGGESYATWLGLDKNSIPIVPNCVTEDFIKPPPQAIVKHKRKNFCSREDQPLILGVFRLSKEKCPLDFVRIIAAVHKKHPKLRAVICGKGADQEQVQALIVSLKLENVLRLLGSVDDIPLMMRCATLLLHTAAIEGSPNVILEAQASGLPIVCAANGGTRQFLAKEWGPYMTEPGDIKNMTRSCLALLAEKAKRKKLAEIVRRRTVRCTSPKALAHNTLKSMGIDVSAATPARRKC